MHRRGKTPWAPSQRGWRRFASTTMRVSSRREWTSFSLPGTARARPSVWSTAWTEPSRSLPNASSRLQGARRQQIGEPQRRVTRRRAAHVVCGRASSMVRVNPTSGLGSVPTTRGADLTLLRRTSAKARRRAGARAGAAGCVVVCSMLRRRRYVAAGGTARTTSPIPLSPGSHAALVSARAAFRAS